MTEKQLMKMKERASNMVWKRLDHEYKDELIGQHKKLDRMIDRTFDAEIKDHLFESRRRSERELDRIWYEAYLNVIVDVLEMLDKNRAKTRELIKENG